jgi:hypothetical protein
VTAFYRLTSPGPSVNPERGHAHTQGSIGRHGPAMAQAWRHASPQFILDRASYVSGNEMQRQRSIALAGSESETVSRSAMAGAGAEQLASEQRVHVLAGRPAGGRCHGPRWWALSVQQQVWTGLSRRHRASSGARSGPAGVRKRQIIRCGFCTGPSWLAACRSVPTFPFGKVGQQGVNSTDVPPAPSVSTTLCSPRLLFSSSIYRSTDVRTYSL